MSLFKVRPFNRDISSKKLNKELNFQFDRGWSPVLVPYIDGTRVVLRISEWVGGEGEPPFAILTNYYLSLTGYTTIASEAVDIAEGYLSSSYKDDIIDATTVTTELLEDEGDGIRYFRMSYDDLEGNSTTLTDVALLQTKTGVETGVSLDDTLGITLGGVKYLVGEKAKWLVIEDWMLAERAIDRAASQNSVYLAIEAAKAKFDVPIIDLDSGIIRDVEHMNDVTQLNPYYAMVGSDDRIGGIYTPVCTEGAACSCSADGGYSEMGDTRGITGCVCTLGVEEVNAVCRVTVTTVGNIGDTYTASVDGVPTMWYTVVAGDTITDVLQGMINSLPSVCGGGSPICTVGNITANSFDLTAVGGLGSEPNAWVKTFIVTGTSAGSFTTVTAGVDFIPTTYRGVKGHLIAYDGNSWYDFGGALTGVSRTSTTVINNTVVNTGIKHYIEVLDDVVVDNYYQYIVYESLTVDGVFTLDGDAELVIIM